MEYVTKGVAREKEKKKEKGDGLCEGERGEVIPLECSRV